MYNVVRWLGVPQVRVEAAPGCRWAADRPAVLLLLTLINVTGCERERERASGCAAPRMHLECCANPHLSAIGLINTRPTSSPCDGKVQAVTSTMWINTPTTAEVYLLKETISCMESIKDGLNTKNVIIICIKMLWGLCLQETLDIRRTTKFSRMSKQIDRQVSKNQCHSVVYAIYHNNNTQEDINS